KSGTCFRIEGSAGIQCHHRVMSNATPRRGDRPGVDKSQFRGGRGLSTRGDSMRRRNLQLDLLRCVGILGVLVTHLTSFRPPNWWWDRLLTQGTWSGVDLFFVISGYLISGLLFSEFQKHGRINFGRFAIRRALKLYPTLYVLVFGVALNRLLVDSTDVT